MIPNPTRAYYVTSGMLLSAVANLSAQIEDLSGLSPNECDNLEGLQNLLHDLFRGKYYDESTRELRLDLLQDDWLKLEATDEDSSGEVRGDDLDSAAE